MKSSLLTFCCLFAGMLSAQKFPAKEFFYTVPIHAQADKTMHGEWWHECMEANQQAAFIQTMLDLVDSGRVTAYSPEYPYHDKLTKAEVQLVLHRPDTLYLDYGYLMEGEGFYVVHHDITASSVHSVSFHEEWSYNAAAKTFVKTVKGIILNGAEMEGDMPQGAPLFYIRFDGKGMSDGAAVNPVLISGFTHDLHTRDLGHVICPSEVLFAGDTTMQQKIRAEVKTLAGEMLRGKKLLLYDTLYPYNKPLDKKTTAARFPELQNADALRFFEDWKIDFTKMTFEKSVRGVVFEKEKEYEIPANEWFDKLSCLSFTRLAFLPLNNYAPSALSFPNEVTMPDFIYRETFFNNPLLYREQTIFTDSAALMKMCIGLCDLVETQKLPAYEYIPYSGEKRLLPKDSAALLFAEAHKADVAAHWYTSSMYEMLPYYYQTTGGLGFTENWMYNASAQTFEKQIQSLTLTHAQLVNYKERYYNLPLFSVDAPPVKDLSSIMKPEFLVAQNIQSPVMINHAAAPPTDNQPYSPQVFYNENVLASSTRYFFMQQIINDALAGKITVYDGTKTGTVLTPAQLRTKIDGLKDSSYVPMDIPNDYLVFQELVFVEDWYFNPATGAFYKKVKEIIFVNSENTADPAMIDFENQQRVFCVKMK